MCIVHVLVPLHVGSNQLFCYAVLYTVHCQLYSYVHCIYPRGDNPESGHAHIHLARLRPPDAAIATP